MTVDQIDENSSVASYLQVAALLRKRIQSGDLKPGDQMPSQTWIIQHYGIARQTAVKALRVLKDENLVVVRPGLGTYVRRS